MPSASSIRQTPQERILALSRRNKLSKKSEREIYEQCGGNSVEGGVEIMATTGSVTMTRRPPVSVPKHPTSILLFGSTKHNVLGPQQSPSIKLHRTPVPAPLNNITSPATPDLALGDNIALIMTEDGEVFSWGSGELGRDPKVRSASRVRTPRGAKFIASSVGAEHCCIISDDQKLYGWGKKSNGRIGRMDGGKSTGSRVTIPKQIKIPSDSNDYDGNDGVDGSKKNNNNENVTAVSCGQKHTGCISNSRLYMFGNNEAGQLGLNNLSATSLPTTPPALLNVTIASVSCGVNHSCAVSRLGECWSWGWGENGRLGLGDESKRLEPCLVEALKDDLVFATEVHAGASHTCVLTDNGDLYAFGWNLYGQCGVPSPTSVLLPVIAMEGKIVSQVSCGFAHTGCVTARGELWLFGFGEEGQLGDNLETSRFEPAITDVDVNEDGVRALSVCCGHTSTMVCVSNESALRNEERRRREARVKRAALVLTRYFRIKLIPILLHKLYEVKEVIVVKAVPRKVVVEDEAPVVNEEELQRERERLAEAQRLQALKEQEEKEARERLRQAEEQERKRIEEAERERLRIEEEEKERRRLELEESERLRLAEEKERQRLEQERLVREEKERIRVELERIREQDENKLMAIEDENSRLQREIRREKIAKYKLRQEQKRIQEQERQARLEKARADAIKKAQDRFKKSIKKPEKKIIRKSTSKSDFSKVNSMADRLKDIATMKKEKEDRERRELEKVEERQRAAKARQQQQREEMIANREKRLQIEREEKEKLRLQEEERRIWERAEELEEERKRLESEEQTRAEQAAEERRQKLREKLKLSDKRAKAALDEITSNSYDASRNTGEFASSKQWGRKLSKGGGTCGVVSHRGSSR